MFVSKLSQLCTCLYIIAKTKIKTHSLSINLLLEIFSKTKVCKSILDNDKFHWPYITKITMKTWQTRKHCNYLI